MLSSNLRNFLYIGLSQGTNFLVQVAFVPYLMRTVGGIHYGYLTIMYSICSFFFIVVDYGFSVTAVRKISVHRNSKTELKNIIASTITAKLILIAVSFPIYSLASYYFLDGGISIDFILLSFFAVIGQAVFPVWLTLGLEENKLSFLTNLTGKILLGVLVFTCITNESDWKYFIFFIGISNTLSGLLLFYWVLKYRLGLSFGGLLSTKTVLKDLAESRELFVSNFSISLYLSSAVLILSQFVSPYLIGIYGVAEKIMLLFRNLTGVFIQAVYSSVCYKVQILKTSALINYVTRITFPFILLIMVLCSLSAIFSSEIAGLFVPESDRQLLSEIIVKFSFLPLCVSLNIVPNLVLFAYSKERIKSIILISFAIISILSSYFLVPILGLDGMIGILYCTEIIIALLSVYFMNRLKYSLNVNEQHI